MRTQKKENPDKVGFGKFMAWQSRGVSLAASFIVFTYLNMYCTDALGMSATLVGTLLLASKIFDGVTDLFAGYLIDNTRTKWGVARPYELSIIGVWGCTWLLFSCPAESGIVLKSVWVFLLYAATNSIFATLLNANANPYLVRAFQTKQQFAKINAYGGIVVTLGAAVVSISFPIAMAAIATSPGGWSRLVGLYAVPLAVIGLLRFVFIKEVNDVDVKSNEKISLKEMAVILKTNKHMYMVAGVTLIFQLISGMNVGSYYFKYIVGDVGLLGMLQAVAMPVSMVVMAFFPNLMKKFSLSQIIAGGAAFGCLGGLCAWFAGDNMILLIVAYILTGIAALAPSYLVGIMLLDCGTFNDWKGHSRMDGTVSAVNNFASKLGNGVGTGVLGILLGFAGYNGSLAVQSESATLMIRSIYSLIPLIGYVFVIVIMKFYKLDKLVVQIESEKAQNS